MNYKGFSSPQSFLYICYIIMQMDFKFCKLLINHNVIAISYTLNRWAVKSNCNLPYETNGPSYEIYILKSSINFKLILNKVCMMKRILERAFFQASMTIILVKLINIEFRCLQRKEKNSIRKRRVYLFPQFHGVRNEITKICNINTVLR